MTTVAFIGLGNMGGPMASNLIKKGYHVVVFDLVQAALDEEPYKRIFQRAREESRRPELVGKSLTPGQGTPMVENSCTHATADMVRRGNKKKWSPKRGWWNVGHRRLYIYCS